jgi:hypothetical protein
MQGVTGKTQLRQMRVHSRQTKMPALFSCAATAMVTTFRF